MSTELLPIQETHTLGPLKIVRYSKGQYELLSNTHRTKQQQKKLQTLQGRQLKEYEFGAVWLFKKTLFVPRDECRVFLCGNAVIVRAFISWSDHIFQAQVGWYGATRHYYKNYCLEDVKLAGYEKTKGRPKFFLQTLWITWH